MIKRLAVRMRGWRKAHCHAIQRDHAAPWVPDSGKLEQKPPVVCALESDHCVCPRQNLPGQLGVPLCGVSPGCCVRVLQVEQGRRCRKRLADLGVGIGSQVRVIQASRGYGPVILAVRNDARLAIGWGMAKKIRVSLVADKNDLTNRPS